MHTIMERYFHGHLLAEGAVVLAILIVSHGQSIAASEIVNNLHYPGHYYDEESGLYYNWHRYYNPGTGRYISSDPLGLAAGYNVYSYANANPIKSFDPEGLLTCGSGWNEPLVPDAPYGFNFSPCCEVHDGCYGICGLSRETCDNDFLDCMNNVCKKIPKPAYARRQICRRVARKYYYSVYWFGRSAYEKGQSHCPDC